MARLLLGLEDAAWNDYEWDYLTKIGGGVTYLTEPQAELLLKLYDGKQRYATMKGFSARAVIEDALRGRDEFTDDHTHMVEFLEDLAASECWELTERQWRFLFACAHVTGTIEGYVAIA